MTNPSRLEGMFVSIGCYRLSGEQSQHHGKHTESASNLKPLKEAFVGAAVHDVGMGLDVFSSNCLCMSLGAWQVWHCIKALCLTRRVHWGVPHTAPT